jgi:alkylhydroperoxidase family enzyme
MYDGRMSKPRAPSIVFEALVDRVLRGAGVTTPEERAAAAGTGPVTGPAAAVIEKVRRWAHKITDEDIAALKAAGMTDDAIYELTIAAAAGVAKRRLDAAMEAIHAAG